jgi:hypothetical protein
MLLKKIFPSMNHLLNPYYLLIFALLSFIGGYGIYRLSIYIHAQFGNIFKSVFDLHQKDKLLFPGIVKEISKIAGEEISLKEQKEQYKYIWRYLQYNLIKTSGGDVSSPQQLLSMKNESNKNEES